MAYNEKLADKVKAIMAERPGFNWKKMFGGVCFLLNGNMACGVLNNDLIVRVGPENYENYLKLPETRPFDTTGRPMKGWVMIAFEGKKTDKDLAIWVERGVSYALELPPKSK